MNKIQEKRLLNVARALRESQNPERFTMAGFVWGDRLLGLKDSWVKPQVEESWCGTPACALGHYAGRTDLQKTFKIRKNLDFSPDGPSAAIVDRDGITLDHIDGQLVQDHFGLNNEEVVELFGATGCNRARTPLDAAKYIEAFVRLKKKQKQKR